MHLKYPHEVNAFRADLARFLDRVVPAELREEVDAHGGRGGGPLTWALWRTLGEAGYLGISWPKAYGGDGKSFLYIDAFFNEMFFRDLPTPETALLTIGPTLIAAGTPEHHARYLPEILRGEADWAIGYSEPESGTDLAALKTRATPKDGGWLINGQKVYTSRAEYCQYIWLAARTDPELPRDKGISVFIVPVASKGVRVDPLPTMARRTNVTFYDDVWVPGDALVGGLNQGWQYITAQLVLERLVVSPIAELERLQETLRTVVAKSPTSASWLRMHLAAFEAELQAMQAMRLRMLSRIEKGERPAWEASLLKIASNECRVRMLGVAMQAIGPRALLRQREDSSAFVEEISGETIEYQMRSSFINLFGGGSNDVLRDLVASRGLGLSR
jgi:3-oxocholest-4-en-26-oyl-CoA dehydrogenase alpha subunit